VEFEKNLFTDESKADASFNRESIMAPKVSVIVPTYNNATLLHETLDGVQWQTFRDFELIVVDDGSTDGTAEAVRRYGKNIRYIHQPNQGPAAARNKGVNLAHGSFIAFCDHDDIWNERHLEKLMDCFAAHPTAAMVFDNAQSFGEGISVEQPHVGSKVALSMTGIVVPIKMLWRCWVASMSVVMVKRSAFEAVGGLHPGILGLDDLHFYLRLATRFEVRYVPYIGCRKRVMARNLLSQVGLKGLVQCLEDLEQHYPEVVEAIGAVRFRTRLARKYRKLAAGYLKEDNQGLAQAMYWKAYKENVLDVRYLWKYLMAARRVITLP
jgi:glycosyltransferase involved in cell wall biosynthesis